MTKEEMVKCIVADCLCQRLTVSEWFEKQKDPNRHYRMNLAEFTPNEWVEMLAEAGDRLKPSLKTKRHNAMSEINEITNRIKNDIDRLQVLNQFLRDTNASPDPAEQQGP